MDHGAGIVHVIIDRQSIIKEYEKNLKTKIQVIVPTTQRSSSGAAWRAGCAVVGAGGPQPCARCGGRS